jgi:CRP-like cAMP-binding protein
MLTCSSSADLGNREDQALGIVEDSDVGIFVLVKVFGAEDRAGQAGKELACVIAEQYRYRRGRLLQEGKWSNCPFNDIQAVLTLSMASSHRAFFEINQQNEFKGYSVVCLAVSRGKAMVGTLGENQFFLLRKGELHRIVSGTSGVRRSTVDRVSSQRSFDNLQLHQRQYNEIVAFDLLPDDRCILCDAEIGDAILGTKASIAMIEKGGIKGLGGILTEKQRSERGAFPVLMVEARYDDPPEEQDVIRNDENLGSIAALRNVYLLQDLDYAQILKIREISTVSDHGVGLPVILQGSTGNSIYVIISGEVTVQMGGAVLAVLKNADHFGEMALLNHSRRNASVYPKSPTRLLTIPGDALRKLLVEDPNIGVRLLWQLATELSNRLVNANQKLQAKARTEKDLVQDQDSLKVELGFSNIGES